MSFTWEKGEWSPPKSGGSVHPPILVIGLGNPILGDDGVGWRVAERVRANLLDRQNASDPLKSFPIEVDCQALGGLSLMERLIGYEQVIIIDSIRTHIAPAGSVSCYALESLPNHTAGHISAAHDTSLQTAIQLGRSMNSPLPEQIMVIGVEAELVYDFSEQLSPPIEAAVPHAEKMTLDLLTKWIQSKAR